MKGEDDVVLCALVLVAAEEPEVSEPWSDMLCLLLMRSGVGG